MRDVGTGVCQQLQLRVIKMDAMGIRDVCTDKLAFFHQLQRPAPISFKAEFIFISGFRQMGMQPNAVLACQLNRCGHQGFSDGKGTAWRQDDFAHGQLPVVVVLLDDPFAIFKNFIFGLHDIVGRQPPVLFTQGHGAPCWGEPHPQIGGGFKLRANQIPTDVLRVHIMMVCGRRTASQTAPRFELPAGCASGSDKNGDGC